MNNLAMILLLENLGEHHMHSKKIEWKLISQNQIYIKSHAMIGNEKLMKLKNYVRFVRRSHLRELIYP